MLQPAAFRVAVFMPTNKLRSLRIVGHLDMVLNAVMIVVLVEKTGGIYEGGRIVRQILDL